MFVMRELSEKEIQAVLLNTLCDIDLFCKEKSIPYYIIGGTLLGAIRHNGFIPWDDDIDIAMHRADYIRFIDLWNDNEHPKYFLQNTNTDPSCRHTITRVLIKGTHLIHNGSYNVTPKHSELFVDIFPLDNVPDDESKREEQRHQLIRIKRKIGHKYLSRASTPIKHYIKKIRQALLYPISYHSLITKLNNISQMYNSTPTECVCSMSSQYDYRRQTMNRSIYGKPQRIEFEGKALLGPEKPHEYLVKLYDDYMKLPPKEKQVFNIKASIDDEAKMIKK